MRMKATEEKKKIRKELEIIREAIPENIFRTTPAKCLKHLQSLSLYQETSRIYIFLSFRSELDTISLIPMLRKDGKKIAVPRVEGKVMRFYDIQGIADCEPGAWGILEPGKSCPLVEETGLMLAPGLVFDLHGGRMGYGGGFYDKYLSQHTDLVKIGLCYEEQLIESIEMEAHDIRMDYILTQERLHKVSQNVKN